MSNKFNSVTPDRKSQSDIWITPAWIIEKLGGYTFFDLDPCGWLPNGDAITETAKRYFTEDTDGLNQPWTGRIFCNPPYSDLKKWMQKMSLHNNGIVLCFARTETKAFQENIKNATGINLINKRIKFLDQFGKERTNGNAPSCLIAWGEDNYQAIKNIDGIYCRIEN